MMVGIQEVRSLHLMATVTRLSVATGLENVSHSSLPIPLNVTTAWAMARLTRCVNRLGRCLPDQTVTTGTFHF